jgi:uncharacterized protein (DUF362 family)
MGKTKVEPMIDDAKSKVILRPVDPADARVAVQDCLEQCNWQEWLARDAVVVIKPNCCTAVADRVVGCNTSVKVVESLCEALLTRTSRIFIGESGHLRQNPWQAFAASGYDEMAKRLGVKLVNFSESPTVRVRCEPVGEIPMPKHIIEADAYINVPVLKTHALTYFTGALKNQWGCVPDCHDRLRYHRSINLLLSSILRVLNPKMVLMDATIGMDGRGPVAGNIRKVDAVLASRDAVAIDATAMRLVGLEPKRAKHVVNAARQGLGRFEVEDIEIDGDWERFATRFEPPPRDFANTAMFFASQYSWFVKYVLANDRLYYPVRNTVVFLRRMGVAAR